MFFRVISIVWLPIAFFWSVFFIVVAVIALEKSPNIIASTMYLFFLLYWVVYITCRVLLTVSIRNKGNKRDFKILVMCSAVTFDIVFFLYLMLSERVKQTYNLEGVRNLETWSRNT